jgi:hypothetical protein
MTRVCRETKKRKFFECSFIDLESSGEPDSRRQSNTLQGHKPSKRLKFNDKVEVFLFTKEEQTTPDWVTESKVKN